MAMHDGHRERLKRRFAREGLDNFSDVQVLELLLFYTIPRKDTNPIAHALLNHFGSLARVLEAPVSELEKVEGIGENAALFLNLMSQCARYYQVSRAQNGNVLDTIQKCGDYLVPRFVGRPNETVMMLCLDAKCKLLCCKELDEGGAHSASISPRKAAQEALAVNASTVILAHNHPSGLAVPSFEDVATTKRIADALNTVGVILADHIIVSDEDFISLAASGLYSPPVSGLRV